MNPQSRNRRRSIIGTGAVLCAVVTASTGTAAADTGLAPVDISKLHAPVPVAPVAPVTPQAGTLRIGDMVVGAPSVLTPDQVAGINGAAAEAEAQVATFGISVGLEPSRSHRVAAATMSGAVVGANVGSALAIPITMTSSTLGAVAGLLAGVPFLPIGLVVGPIIGGAIGTAIITVPASLIGGAVGAAIGAATALAAPATVAPHPAK